MMIDPLEFEAAVIDLNSPRLKLAEMVWERRDQERNETLP